MRREEVTCEEPLLTIDRQIGVNVVHPEGRDSKTIFKRLSYDEKSNTSVIHCRPITGRSHQIRVHLQFMGHPIANDPVYQNTKAWGEQQGKGGVFGKARGGTEAQKMARKVAGDLLLEKELAKAKRDTSTNPSLNDTTEVATPDTDNADFTPTDPSSRPYNKQGRLKAGFEHTTPLTADDGDRAAHDNALTPEARAAIAVLREAKDEADGQARERDTKGIQSEIRRETRRKARELGQDVAEDSDEDEKDNLGYCEVCFTPNVPEPKPEELFIWLHAMRCKPFSFWSFAGASADLLSPPCLPPQTTPPNGTTVPRCPSGLSLITRCPLLTTSGSVRINNML